MTDIQQEIAALKQRIAQLEARTHIEVNEWPKHAELFYLLEQNGTKDDHYWDKEKIQHHFWKERGLIFRTREEAERADKKRIAIAEWNRLAGDQSWVDWMDEKEKFYPCYDHNDGIWKIDYQYNLQKWPFAHHKTKADCKAAIAKMGERMSWLLY